MTLPPSPLWCSLDAHALVAQGANSWRNPDTKGLVKRRALKTGWLNSNDRVKRDKYKNEKQKRKSYVFSIDGLTKNDKKKKKTSQKSVCYSLKLFRSHTVERKKQEKGKKERLCSRIKKQKMLGDKKEATSTDIYGRQDLAR